MIGTQASDLNRYEATFHDGPYRFDESFYAIGDATALTRARARAMELDVDLIMLVMVRYSTIPL